MPIINEVAYLSAAQETVALFRGFHPGLQDYFESILSGIATSLADDDSSEPWNSDVPEEFWDTLVVEEDEGGSDGGNSGGSSGGSSSGGSGKVVTAACQKAVVDSFKASTSVSSAVYDYVKCFNDIIADNGECDSEKLAEIEEEWESKCTDSWNAYSKCWGMACYNEGELGELGCFYSPYCSPTRA
jgi:hypothetical protein